MDWFWLGLLLGVCLGLVAGAFLWTALTLREVDRRQRVALDRMKRWGTNDV